MKRKISILQRIHFKFKGRYFCALINSKEIYMTDNKNKVTCLACLNKLKKLKNVHRN